MDGIDRYEAEGIAEGKAREAAAQVERTLDGRIDELRRDLERETQGLRERASMIEAGQGELRGDLEGRLDYLGSVVDAALAKLGEEIRDLNSAQDGRLDGLRGEIAAEKRERATGDLALAGECAGLRDLIRGMGDLALQRITDSVSRTLRERGNELEESVSQVRERVTRLEGISARKVAELEESVRSLERHVGELVELQAEDRRHIARLEEGRIAES